MENKLKSNPKTRKDYVTGLALENKINADLSSKSNNVIHLNRIPSSMEEAVSYSKFWGEILDEFEDNVDKIDFFYQEKNKQLPLSSKQKFLKSIGFKVNPKMQEGEVKYTTVSPLCIREVSKFNENSLVKMITEEKEWNRLNALSRETNDFHAPFALLPKNLCYHVNVPLECIEKITFDQYDFLNQEYKSENKNKK